MYTQTQQWTSENFVAQLSTLNSQALKARYVTTFRLLPCLAPQQYLYLNDGPKTSPKTPNNATFRVHLFQMLTSRSIF
jgi:hypothetical protein